MFYENKRFLRRPLPYPDESLAGYIIRLSESNYYPSPNFIFQLSGLNKRGIYANVFHPGIDDLSQLSKISGIEESLLWLMTFPTVVPNPIKYGSSLKVFESIVPHYTLTKRKAKLCQICLQSKAYCRKIWDLSVVSVCPFHSCLLIDKCPKCFQNITWLRPSITRCNCGIDWRDYQPDEILDPQNLVLSLHIYKLCKIRNIESENFPNLSLLNPLCQLNLASLMQILFSLIKFRDFDYIGDKFLDRIQSPISPIENYKFCFDRVFWILINWEEEFLNWMLGYEDYLENIDNSSEQSLKKYDMVLTLFKSIFKLFLLNEHKFILNVMEVYFWSLLSRMSIKKVKISLKTKLRVYSLYISLEENQSPFKRFTQKFGLQGMSLGFLLNTSQFYIQDDTIFFKMG